MTDSLKDIHAVVTGGARGIGAAIADRLDALGVRLTLMGRQLDPLKKKCTSLRPAQASAVYSCTFLGATAGCGLFLALIGPLGALGLLAATALAAVALSFHAGRAGGAPLSRTLLGALAAAVVAGAAGLRIEPARSKQR